MSTAVRGMQSLGAQHPHCELLFDMNSRTPSVYSSSDHWDSSLQVERTPMTSSDYLAFSAMADTRPSDFQAVYRSNFHQISSNDYDLHNEQTTQRSFNNFKAQPTIDTTVQDFTTNVNSTPAVLTATKKHMSSFAPATVSPSETHFEVDYASLESDTRSTSENYMPHNSTPGYTESTSAPTPLLAKRRCDSLQYNFEPQSPTMPQEQVRRRRGSEYAEPGSARAIYLEKNRKAASKCRGKQKRQQEELVETARDVERRNKILKAEVEFLRSDMRDLMEIVGQHTNCPDARLKLYVQREADRLANGGQRSTVPSPLSGSFHSGPGSDDKTSSLDGE